MSRPRTGRGTALAALGLALLPACGNLTATEDGVATLVLLVPLPAEVEVGQTRPLTAVTLGPSGDTLAVPVVWRALDTTIVVDSTRGELTGITAGRTGRVVARTGGLYSEIVTFRVLARADTVVRIGPATLTMAPGETFSPEMPVRLDGGAPAVPAPDRRVVYRVVEPAFPDPAQRTVEFVGGTLTRTAVTSAAGLTQGVRIIRVAGRPAPDSAVIRVDAWRPGGADAIPGSGQRFVIRFTAGP
jgi:hypothetical protein